MKNICVIGTGYVGLVTGTCFAEWGNSVTCVDIDNAKIERLRQGHMPIYEPTLEERVARNVQHRRLRFTSSYAEALSNAEFAFIAVPTPTSESHMGADLRYIRAAAASIAKHLDHDLIVVTKSTVPVGTGEIVCNILRANRRIGCRTFVVSNPEFLREGSAFSDCLQPSRVVLGSHDKRAAEQVAALYSHLGCPILVTDLATAEMVKYASNAMLATRISFMNELAGICERTGADVKLVAAGMGFDQRIGPAFLDAGLGYGGSCFPKDVNALRYMGEAAGLAPKLLAAVDEINREARLVAVAKLEEALGTLSGRTVALLGLAFKPHTDDLRESPGMEIARRLLQAGAHVRACDPEAIDSARRFLPALDCGRDPYETAAGADALVLVTEWPEFVDLDFGRLKRLMRSPLVVDGRNALPAEELVALGFDYRGIGRYNALSDPALDAARGDELEAA